MDMKHFFRKKRSIIICCIVFSAILCNIFFVFCETYDSENVNCKNVFGLSERTLDNSVVDIKLFGAVGDGVANDTKAVQNAVEYAVTNRLTLKITKSLGPYIISDSIKIRGPLKIIFDGGIIRQTTWGKPGIEVRSADVIFEGDCNIDSIEDRKKITVASVKEAIGDPKASSSGVILCNESDRFKAGTINCSGFVAALTLLGKIKENIEINKLIVNNVDFGLFGSGFNNLRIDTVYAKNIINSQGEPEHAVYITGSEAGYRNKKLTINDIYAENIPGGTHIASIKSTYDLFIKSISGKNVGAVLNCQWTKGFIDKICTNTTVIPTDALILAQNIDTDIEINSLYIKTNTTKWAIAATTGAILTLQNPRIIHTNMDFVATFRNSAVLRVYNPIVEYEKGKPHDIVTFLNVTNSAEKMIIVNPKVINHV